MARKKIREYDSKRLLKEHFKRLSGRELPIKSAQVSEFFLHSSFFTWKMTFDDVMGIKSLNWVINMAE